MTTGRPESHLLRELHVLATALVVLVGFLADPHIVQKIGPIQVIQAFGILFVAGAMAFWAIGLILTRKLPVVINVWSVIVSATANMAAVGGSFLAFRIWYNKWPFNLEPVEPTGFEGPGASFFLLLLLLAFSGLVWLLGLLAVGATTLNQDLKLGGI
jgi:hypothetical protein